MNLVGVIIYSNPKPDTRVQNVNVSLYETYRFKATSTYTYIHLYILSQTHTPKQPRLELRCGSPRVKIPQTPNLEVLTFASLGMFDARVETLKLNLVPQAAGLGQQSLLSVQNTFFTEHFVLRADCDAGWKALASQAKDLFLGCT